MQTYALVQCIGWPFMTAIAWLLYMNKTGFTFVQPILIRYVIIFMRLLFTAFRVYVGFNSLIVAMCRYSFIVHENHVFKIGIERMRYIFLSGSIVFPIFIAILNDATQPIELAWICMFMPQNDTSEIQ